MNINMSMSFRDRVEGPGLFKRRRDYTPVNWKNYFDSFQDIAVSDLGVSFDNWKVLNIVVYLHSVLKKVKSITK